MLQQLLQSWHACKFDQRCFLLSTVLSRDRCVLLQTQHAELQSHGCGTHRAWHRTYAGFWKRCQQGESQQKKSFVTQCLHCWKMLADPIQNKT